MCLGKILMRANQSLDVSSFSQVVTQLTPYMTAEKFPAPSVPLAFQATALLPRAVVLGLNPQALLQMLANFDSFNA